MNLLGEGGLLLACDGESACLNLHQGASSLALGNPLSIADGRATVDLGVFWIRAKGTQSQVLEGESGGGGAGGPLSCFPSLA